MTALHQETSICPTWDFSFYKMWLVETTVFPPTILAAQHIIQIDGPLLPEHNSKVNATNMRTHNTVPQPLVTDCTAFKAEITIRIFQLEVNRKALINFDIFWHHVHSAMIVGNANEK